MLSYLKLIIGEYNLQILDYIHQFASGPGKTS